MPRPISLFFHNQAQYDCHTCGEPMNRLDTHGWHWGCHKCQKSFPLYVLDPKAVEVKKEEEGFLGKFKDMIHGGRNG